MRACFPIAIVILLATFACHGGTGSDYPNAADPGAGPRADAGVRDPGADEEDAQGPSGGASLDAASEQSADAAPSSDSCPPPSDAGDSGDADGDVPDANVDAQGVDAEVDAGDGAADAGDAATDAEPARDAQVDTGANFPDAAGDAELPLSDASGDAAHITSEGGSCVP